MMTDRIKQIAFYIMLAALWQAVYFIGVTQCQWWKPYAFPSPAGVIESFIDMSRDGGIVCATGHSLWRGAVGLVIAIAVGTFFGVVITVSRYLNQTLKPLLLGIQSLPSICWVPFAILWFGLKDSSIIFVVVMGSVFSVSLVVESSIKNVPPVYLKAAKTMGAGSRDLWLHVMLPAAVPALLSGLRQVWSFAWRALMSGEVMSASAGLGYALMMGRDMADINQVMAVMIVIIMVGMVIDRVLLSRVEHRALKKRGLVHH